MSMILTAIVIYLTSIRLDKIGLFDNCSIFFVSIGWLFIMAIVWLTIDISSIKYKISKQKLDKLYDYIQNLLTTNKEILMFILIFIIFAEELNFERALQIFFLTSMTSKGIKLTLERSEC